MLKILIKFLESTTNELNNIKLELEMAKSRIQEFESEIGSQIKKDFEIAEVKNQELLEKNPEFGIKSQSNKRKRKNFENQSEEKETKLECDKSGNGYQTTQKHDKLFKCNSCPKVFENKYNLNSHIPKVHFKKKQFHCDKCSTGFTEDGSLRQHISLVQAMTEEQIQLRKRKRK